MDKAPGREGVDRYGDQMAAEYDHLFGATAEGAWRQGVLADIAALNLPDRATVVDLGAGTGIGGRLLLSTLFGARRIGVDASEAMLRQATPWYDTTTSGDLRELPLPAAAADLVVSGFDTLNYLDPVGLARCMREVSRCLVPGGWLVFDYSSPQLLRVSWRDRSYLTELANGMVRWRHRYDETRQRCVSSVRRHDETGALLWHEEHVQYALDTHDVHAAAVGAGLRVERVRDLERAHFSPAAHTHVWLLYREQVP